nr:TetR/AcrR family transcriptional regulator C-terminal domain-containing protein [Paenibacillus artemisiicola]
MPLERGRILEAALKLLDELGLKDLSMRKIADDLQVKTASLYYHVKDKEALMQLLSDRICGGMERIDPSLPWREQLSQWAGQFRNVLLSRRDAFELFHQTIANGDERLTQIERLFQCLASAGFPDRQVPWLASMVKTYVLGFAAEEARFRARASGFASREAMNEQQEQAFRRLPEERFPNMVRLAAVTTSTDWEQEFRFGLSVLLDGFAAKLPAGANDE